MRQTGAHILLHCPARGDHAGTLALLTHEAAIWKVQIMVDLIIFGGICSTLVVPWFCIMLFKPSFLASRNLYFDFGDPHGESRDSIDIAYSLNRILIKEWAKSYRFVEHKNFASRCSSSELHR